MIQNLSENVIVPIAGLVITYVLCYELISMVTEKNNMHDVDTFMFFKWFFKAFVAVFLVTHTFDITMAVFDMAQHIVSGAAGVIGGDTNIDVTEALAAMQEGLKDMEIPELLLLPLKRTIRRQQGRGFPVLKQTYSIILRCLGYRRTPYPAMNA
jgi:hypothetical protein